MTRDQLHGLRLNVIQHLTNEAGYPLEVLPWWREALTALDDPNIRELILLLLRQDGKSTLCGALANTELLCVANSYTVLVAASERQQQVIFDRKVRKPLERLLRALGKQVSARFTRNGVEFPDRNSALEVVASTEDTTPGRTVSLLIIDEARFVRDEVYTALAPSVLATGGKVVVASTAGPPRGFLYQLRTHPTPETWLYESTEHTNPFANKGVLDFLRNRLALVNPSAARRELHGEFTDDGDELIASGLIDAAVDDTLGELPTHRGEAYAFLDLSRKRDLTSLVVVVSAPPQRPDATDHLLMASVQTWDPRQSATGEVDFEEVRDALGRLPYRFPNLRRLLVDEGAEAGAILPWARTHPLLALRVEGFVGSVSANQDIWSALLARLNGRTLSLPRHDRLIAELRGLRREAFALGSRWRVVDSSRKLHRDVSLALAGAVWAAGSATVCPHCRDESCEYPLPPFLPVHSPEYVAWCKVHPDPDEVRPAPVDDDGDRLQPTQAERAELLRFFEPLCLALERGDEQAAERAADGLEAHLAAVERDDAHAGARVRALAATVQDALERTLDALP